MGKVLLEGFQCERCRHTWLPREKVKDKKEKNEKEQPTICPSCKSPYWNKPKTRNQKTVPDNVQKKMVLIVIATVLIVFLLLHLPFKLEHCFLIISNR